MIQNGQTESVPGSEAPRHPRIPSTSSAFLHRSPYRYENERQTTEPIQNGGFLDRDFPSSSHSDLDSERRGHESKFTPYSPADGQTLSFEQMWELQKILDRRVKCKLSEGLSPEGRKAMELARAEVEFSKRKGKKTSYSNRDFSMPDLELPNRQKRGKVKKKISFVDAYESSSASRFSGDLLDENSSEGNPRRWALGGGNINVAMETVEIVSYGDTGSSDVDDIAIEETAKLNSVEKCLVWMGVHTEDDYNEER